MPLSFLELLLWKSMHCQLWLGVWMRLVVNKAKEMKCFVLVQLLPCDLERVCSTVGIFDFFTQQEPWSGLCFLIFAIAVLLSESSLTGFAGGGSHWTLLLNCCKHFCSPSLCFFQLCYLWLTAVLLLVYLEKCSTHICQLQRFWASSNIVWAFL